VRTPPLVLNSDLAGEFSSGKPDVQVSRREVDTRTIVQTKCAIRFATLARCVSQCVRQPQKCHRLLMR